MVLTPTDDIKAESENVCHVIFPIANFKAVPYDLPLVYKNHVKIRRYYIARVHQQVYPHDTNFVSSGLREITA